MKLKPILCLTGGVLGAVVLGVLTFLFVFDNTGGHNTKWSRTYTEMGEIQKALNQYALEHDGYPESLEALREDYFPNSVPEDRFTKQPYHYVTNGQSFALISYGHNEAPGELESNDRDIVYTEHGCLTDWQ